VVGNDRGDYYFLYPDDLENLAIFTPENYDGRLSFTMTTVAVEDDGDIALSESIPFSVTFLPDEENPPPAGSPPLPPEIAIGDPVDRPDETQPPTTSPTFPPGGGPPAEPTPTGPPASGPTTPSGSPVTLAPTVAGSLLIDTDTFNFGSEDNPLILDIKVEPAEGETRDPVITITLSDIPEGFEVTGATFNPLTNTYSADAQDFKDGKVQITPPQDFNGFFDITVEVLATTGFATSTETVLRGYFDPVADGVNIDFSPTEGTEDDTISASIDYTFKSNFDTEVLVNGFVYFKIDDEAALPFPIVQSGDPDAFLYEESFVGFYRIPSDQAEDFNMQLQENWHGTLSGLIKIPVIEKDDDDDGDNVIISERYDTLVNSVGRCDENSSNSFYLQLFHNRHCSTGRRSHCDSAGHSCCGHRGHNLSHSRTICGSDRH
jgi:hypothetical protein